MNILYFTILFQNPLTSIGEFSGGNKDTVDKYLLIWYFEARLKEHYSNFIKAIEVTRTLFIVFNVNRIIPFLVTKSQIYIFYCLLFWQQFGKIENYDILFVCNLSTVITTLFDNLPTKYNKYRLLHGIFHIIPFISPRS
jgi:hypothetical protein